MSSMDPNNTFVWFIGKVVDINDPKKLGRVRVKVPAYHDELEDEEIPWGTPVNPIQSASTLGVGVSPTGLLNSAMVLGFFADGSDARIPIILGSIAKINFGLEELHDVNPLARGINDISKELIQEEPKSTYNSKYPHNKVMRTSSGHTIEFDDTPGASRIHIYHKSGTYIEINDDGTKVSKSVKDDYHLVANNQTIYIGGDAKINIEGDLNVKINGKTNIESEDEMTFIAPKINLNP